MAMSNDASFMASIGAYLPQVAVPVSDTALCPFVAPSCSVTFLDYEVGKEPEEADDGGRRRLHEKSVRPRKALHYRQRRSLSDDTEKFPDFERRPKFERKASPKKRMVVAGDCTEEEIKLACDEEKELQEMLEIHYKLEDKCLELEYRMERYLFEERGDPCKFLEDLDKVYYVADALSLTLAPMIDLAGYTEINEICQEEGD